MSCSGLRSRTGLWPASDLPGFHACPQAQQVRQYFRQWKEWVLASSESLRAWLTTSPSGSKTFYDSLGETNSILKKKNRAIFSEAQTGDDISSWSGYKKEPPILQYELSPMWWIYCPGLFPNWDSRLLLMRDFPVLYKSGYRSLAQFGDVYAVTSLYYLYFCSFNDCILT